MGPTAIRSGDWHPTAFCSSSIFRRALRSFSSMSRLGIREAPTIKDVITDSNAQNGPGAILSELEEALMNEAASVTGTWGCARLRVIAERALEQFLLPGADILSIEIHRISSASFA